MPAFQILATGVRPSAATMGDCPLGQIPAEFTHKSQLQLHINVSATVSDVSDTVSDVSATVSRHRITLTCNFHTDGPPHLRGPQRLHDGEIFYRFNVSSYQTRLPNHQAILNAGADACFVALFPIASALEYTAIQVSPTGISCGLARQVPEITGVYELQLRGRRDSRLARMTAVGPVRDVVPPHKHRSRNGAGVSLTGGVDSWFSVVTHKQELSSLVYALNFDVQQDDKVLWRSVSRLLTSAAASLKLPLTFVDTNLRRHAETGWQAAAHKWGGAPADYGWGRLSHGHCLASVYHALSATTVSRAYIPSTHTYGFNAPWGSDALHDHLWSSDELTIVHDGSYMSRLAKTYAITSSNAHKETVLSSLRVCWRNPKRMLNCGRCEKCVRTMVGLEVAGTRTQCSTFDPVSSAELTDRINALPRIRSSSHGSSNSDAAMWQEFINHNGDARFGQRLPKEMIKAIQQMMHAGPSSK